MRGAGVLELQEFGDKQDNGEAGNAQISGKGRAQEWAMEIYY